MSGNGHEKSPLKSKKFLAFLWSDATLKALAVVLIAWAWNLDEMSTRVFLLLLVLIVVSGFVTVGYILKQAGLDRFVRLAQIAASAGVDMVTKGVTLKSPSKAGEAGKGDEDEG